MASGQQINLAKSSVFFSANTREDIRCSICSSLNIPEAGPSSLYLGLPNILGRNKSVLLGYLRDKMRNRIEQWEGRLLSKAGKEVLIKTVAQSLPSYAMSVFLLPKNLCADMERLMCRYWWRGSSRNGKSIHWKRWESLTVHKIKGGMGFRDLGDFNRALLCKQSWRLLCNPESLVGRVYKARYYKNSSFLGAKIGSNPSYIWRSLLEVKPLIIQGARWHVGNGESIKVISDPWLLDESNPCVTTFHPSLVDAKVSALMHVERGGWDVDLVHDIFNERDASCILNIPLSPNRDRDCWYWSFETSGYFSVKF
ncbi:uncharacterized protein LOC133777401 [Humulus lupulus]|uniref:uncharacterized protein LOC133777401 n=1 Tax=Humulus lupulus TaxID=3486 RepID=UPI002B4091E6|nr:uncharacterized protein LOC133777401 [Humulus lupulus]